MKGREIIISPCNKCGKCCHDREIRITPDEAEIISAAADKPVQEFAVQQGRVFILRTIDNRCIFLKDRRCMIYEAKPFQCKTYPIIYHHLALKSKEFKGFAWTLEMKYLVFSCERNEHAKSSVFLIVCNKQQKDFYILKRYMVKENK